MTAPVTVGVPVYNGERYIGHALDSILAQTYGDFVLAVADNSSTDSTQEIVRSYQAQDSRITYVRHETNIGGAANCNFLLDHAKTKWFKWGYADDGCSAGLLAESVEALSDGSVIGACPRVRLIDENSKIIGQHPDSDIDLSMPSPAERITCILRRVLGQVQFSLFDTELGRQSGGISASTAGEIVFPVALALRGPIHMIRDNFVDIRIHDSRFGGTRESEAVWINPARPRVPFPYSRRPLLLVRAVLDAPLKSRERRACFFAAVHTGMKANLRTLAGDILRAPADLGITHPHHRV